MVVHVEVGPTEPGALRHPAEYRMPLPFGSPWGDALHSRRELSDVRGEVDGPRAFQLLIDFRPSEDSRRPRQRKIQDHPLDDRPLKQACGVAHRLLTRSHPKRVSQVAHHLVCRHPPPATHTFRAHRSQPLNDLGLVALPGKRLHYLLALGPHPQRRLTLMHRRGFLEARGDAWPQALLVQVHYRPRSRSPPASRNASSARSRPASASATSA
jgi:hypothetical protein